MIYEHAHITVVTGREDDFERAFVTAAPILASAPGCRSVALYPSADTPSLYLLHVGWDCVEDHLERFPTTPQAAAFADAVAEFFSAPPTVTHFDEQAVGPSSSGDADRLVHQTER